MKQKDMDYNDLVEIDLNEEEDSYQEQQKITKYRKKQKKKKRRRKIFLMLGILSALILIAYGVITYYYQTRFFPNTIINGVNCGNLTVQEATVLLESQKEYSFEVRGRNPKNETENIVLGILEEDDMELVYVNTMEELSAVLEQQNYFLWIEAFLGTIYEDEILMSVDFNQEQLEKTVSQWEAFKKTNMKVPENAYIGEYSSETGSYELVPETLGTLFDKKDVLEKIGNAIYQNEIVIDLEEEQCYKVAEITSENMDLVQKWETINTWVSTNVVYDWNSNKVVLNGDTIHEWISLEEEEPILNEEAVTEFVKTQAKQYDTYGKNRRFVTSLGVELTLPSGAYGWKTDRKSEAQELLQLIYQGSQLEKEPVYSSKGAKKGSNDIGNSYVEIDLSNQHLYLYSKGSLVLETDLVSGDMNKSGYMTPPGVFGLTYKTRNAVLRGDNYETPVNYWMPFNGNIGMHDATWRNKFGGDIYLKNGSHGCINLPLDMAATIYSYVSTAFPVICYYY